MTKREVMQMALDALNAVYANPDGTEPWGKCTRAMEVLSALAA